MKPEPELLPCPKIMPLRFASKIKFVNNCWEWTGAKQSGGYGHLAINGKHFLAHRYSYSFHYGGIPEGMTIDHICRNRLCVNPYHLRVLTQKENNLCGLSTAAINKRKQFCIKGHLLSEENIIVKKCNDGAIRRYCKTCCPQIFTGKRGYPIGRYKARNYPNARPKGKAE